MILLRHLVAFGEVILNATVFQVVRYNDDILQKAQCHLSHGALGFPDMQAYTSDILPEASTLEAQSTQHWHHLRSHAVANNYVVYRNVYPTVGKVAFSPNRCNMPTAAHKQYLVCQHETVTAFLRSC